jgi:hypothetical protein
MLDDAPLDVSAAGFGTGSISAFIINLDPAAVVGFTVSSSGGGAFASPSSASFNHLCGSHPRPVDTICNGNIMHCRLIAAAKDADRRGEIGVSCGAWLATVKGKTIFLKCCPRLLDR